jgi:hypothetical protein
MKALTNGETKIDDGFFDGGNVESLNHDILAFWRFEESSGTRYDSRGGAHLTENYTTPSISGARGSAANCSLASSPAAHVFSSSLSASRSMTDDISFAFWVYRSSNITASAQEIILSLGDTEVRVWVGDFDAQADFSDLRLNYNGSIFTFDDVINFPSLGHFVLNVKTGGSTADLYMNGAFAGSNSTGAVVITPTTIEFCSISNGSELLNGYLDSVGIWNRILTQNEINALYNGNNNLD